MISLPDRGILLAVGVSLVMAGIIFRGFAASARRDIARRKEHRLAERKSGDAYMSDELAKPPGWFERNLGLLANIVLVTGVVMTVLGYTRG
jgi:hypothetical protein